ncbi:hypothetical protein [Usitatibacter palustris]|uniref:Uncharacterized protein n=1 Tax=Usitatibacter palustris TaxID=2732487 RepID=A0A6M4H841_9PROT|nr:hypothetical protein [Usitatibacter palustris]QJR15325.1 hypothetical protein DSM104440_02144 [Usitatibacter palustris]
MSGTTLQDFLITPPDKRVYVGIPRPRYAPSVAAGMIAGFVALGLWAALGRIVDGSSSWQPFHQLAAVFLGAEALDPIGSYDLPMIGIAIAMVLAAGALVGVALSRIVIGAKPRSAPVIGLVAGLALYGLTFYGFAYFFPWFADARGWIPLVAFAASGLFLTLLYRPFKFQRKQNDLQ